MKKTNNIEKSLRHLLIGATRILQGMRCGKACGNKAAGQHSGLQPNTKMKAPKMITEPSICFYRLISSFSSEIAAEYFGDYVKKKQHNNTF